MHLASECANCGIESKSKRRDFSAQAWSALVVWGEIDEVVVDAPVCESCYVELRDVLIDRADEIDQIMRVAINNGQQPAGKGHAGKVA